MSSNEHLDRLASIWKDSPDTRADVEKRYPGLAWAIENALTHGWTPSVTLMSRESTKLYRQMVEYKPRQKVNDDVVSDVIRAGRLALRLGRVERITFHEDNRRPETDTDHTVMLGMIACAFAREYLPRKLDVGRVAELALTHDAVEAYAGDVSTLRELDEAAKARKQRDEHMAWVFIKRTLTLLPWVADTIEEYESRAEPEAIYVWAMDKLMPKITHLLNNGVTLHDNGMSRDDLVARYESQRVEISKRLDSASAMGVDLSPVMTLRDALIEKVMTVYDEDDDRRETVTT